MKKEQVQMTEREMLEKKASSGRSNLLLAIIFTVVNIVMYFAGSESILLFSVSVPFFSVILADVLGIGTVGIVFAAIILAIYLLCWILSKKRIGWMVVSLVLFALDTLCMVGMYIWLEDVSGIMDAVIHVLVLYYLFSGIRAAKALKKLPPEEAAAVPCEVEE